MNRIEKITFGLVMASLAAPVFAGQVAPSPAPIAGIGIGGGVASYLDARRAGIATLKILGATSGDITRIYALQIGAAALDDRRRHPDRSLSPPSWPVVHRRARDPRE